MAGQPTMSGQDGHLSEQTFGLLDGYFDRTCKQVTRKTIHLHNITSSDQEDIHLFSLYLLAC